MLSAKAEFKINDWYVDCIYSCNGNEIQIYIQDDIEVSQTPTFKIDNVPVECETDEENKKYLKKKVEDYKTFLANNFTKEDLVEFIVKEFTEMEEY